MIRPSVQTLRDLFAGPVHYAVPVYQRPYVWNKEEHWTPLWEDIREVAERYELESAGTRDRGPRSVAAHFLGAIVIELRTADPGRVHEYTIIDGQQRLTTLQLLVAAFREVALERGDPDAATGAEGLLRNTGRHVQGPLRFKVWPGRYDSAHFRAAIASPPDGVGALQQFSEEVAWTNKNVGEYWGVTHLTTDRKVTLCGRPIPASPLGIAYGADARDPGYECNTCLVIAQRESGPGSSNALAAGKWFFQSSIRAWLDEQPHSQTDVRLSALHDVLDGLIQIVAIQLDGSLDAQVVFETLNSRGADLTSLDLAKNAMLQRAERAGLDAAGLHDEHWEPALGDAGYWLEAVRQGRYLRERSDLFLMHWLTMRLGEPPRGQHLFADFRSKVLRADPPPDVGVLLPELCRDAGLFRSFDSFDRLSPEGRFFRCLSQMDTTTVLPVALWLFGHAQIASWQRLRALKALESWLVRRMLLGATSQHYNRLVSRLLSRIKDGPASEADVTVLATLRGFDNPTDRWPSDDEVRARIQRQPLYGWISQRRIAMLLEACEYHIAETESAEALAVPDGLSVEHALPQEWREHWPLPEGSPDREQAEQDREDRVHRLGNLTLVTQKLNSRMSNAHWALKRGELSKRSQLLVNQRMCLQERWDEKAIDARGEELAMRITAVWPGPDSPVWQTPAAPTVAAVE